MLPGNFFDVAEVDFSSDIFSDWATDSWFRLGGWTIKSHRSRESIEDVVFRQSLLLQRGDFARVYDRLEWIGNVLSGIGKPGGSVLGSGESSQYRYFPFHQFNFSFTGVVGEPLVFLRSDTSGDRLVINPDLCFFLELEQRNLGSGIWWDPRRGADVLLRRIIADGALEIVEIRKDYLLKYLQARQMSLLVGHYRHLNLFNPDGTTLDRFVTGDFTVGGQEEGAKALVQSAFRKDLPSLAPFLQRRLHLWFEVQPPEIDAEDPWRDQPSFDTYKFTLPTGAGPVAPARFRDLGTTERAFDGEVCEFLEQVYFRQEVLTKYEGAAGFDIADDGSVSCHNYWGLNRSTSRIGNELLATAIGDFAEGLPFEEWPHWKQYAVEPVSLETMESLRQEQTVPAAVRSVFNALDNLNRAFLDLADSLGVVVENDLWCGSLESLAGRQLRWVYPSSADDDEFLKRATLASTLVIEALDPAQIRKVINGFGTPLHMNFETPPRPLGSRNLLQRLTLTAVLVEKICPPTNEIPLLVQQAESKAKSEDPDLQAELQKAFQLVREEFAPLAFLYDLRTFGGLAHTPNKARAAAAAAQLGLPEENWHRTDYLRLLNQVSECLVKIAEHFEIGAEIISARR
jgi:hypothetical protein